MYRFLFKLSSKFLIIFVSRSFKVFDISSDTEILPWRIRGKRNNRLSIGSQGIIRSNIIFEKDNAELLIGDRCFLGKAIITIAAKVSIGNDVLISWGVTVADHNSHSIKFSERKLDVLNWRSDNKDWNSVDIQDISIGDKVWIGFNAILLKGVTIGEGAIVGAGSVVTKDVAPFTIVAGNPAKVIRELRTDERC